MLILSDSYSLWVDLYELCERILNSSGDGCSTSLPYIEVRKFLGCKLACGVYRCSCFVGYHVLDRCVQLADKLCDHHLRLSGCCSVSNGYQRDAVLFDESFHSLFCLGDLVLRSGREYDYSVKNLAGWIHHRKLTSGSECRIPSKYSFTCDRRLHEQLLEIRCEYLYCTILGAFGEGVSDLPLYGRCDKSGVAVVYDIIQNL